jgi:hypothetical protein
LIKDERNNIENNRCKNTVEIIRTKGLCEYFNLHKSL